MAYFYGSLAVLGWIWTAIVVLALVVWKLSRSPKDMQLETAQPNADQH